MKEGNNRFNVEGRVKDTITYVSWVGSRIFLGRVERTQFRLF